MVPTPPPRAAGASRGASRRVGPTVAPTAVSTPPDTDPRPAGTRRRGTTRWWLYVVLTLGLIAMVMPFIWMILGSFKTNAEIRQYPTNFWPIDPTLDNYTQLFGRLDFATFFTNSIIVALFVTLGNIVFSSMDI